MDSFHHRDIHEFWRARAAVLARREIGGFAQNDAPINGEAAMAVSLVRRGADPACATARAPAEARAQGASAFTEGSIVSLEATAVTEPLLSPDESLLSSRSAAHRTRVRSHHGQRSTLHSKTVPRTDDLPPDFPHQARLRGILPQVSPI